MAETREWLLAFIFVFMATGALGSLYFFNPSTSALYTTCPLVTLTGCHCPRYRSLRALHQLTRGHLVAAFGPNPLIILSVPFIGYYFVSHAMFAVVGRSLRIFFVRPVFI